LKAEENSHPRRAWLIAFALGFLALAITTAIRTQHAPASSAREVVEVAKNLNGKVWKREPSSAVATVKKQTRDHGMPRSEAVLEKYFPKVLDHVRIENGELTTNDLQIICSHPPLRTLDINGVELTASHYDILATAHQLEALYLGSRAVHVPSVGKLSALKGLKDLDMDHSGLNDESLRFIGGMKRLHFLSLMHTSIEGPILTEVRKLPQLQHLDISHTKISDTYLTNLSDMHSLKELNLGERITDAGVPHFVGLTNLRSLGLLNSMVDNPGLNRLLKGLPNLTNLHLFHVEAFIGEVDWKAYPNVTLQAAY